MNEPHLKASDYFFAALPAAGSLTLAEVNALVGITGGLLGIAFLLWKWRREARKNSNPPFSRD